MSKHESDMLSAGYCEFLTPVKTSGKAKAARLLIVFGCLALALVMLVLTLDTIPTVSFMLFAILVFVSWFVWQFTKIEYEYVIATGELELSKIYGERVRKKVLEIKMSDVSSIAPLSSADEMIKNAENILYACNKNDENALCIAYTKDGKKSVLVIAAPDKTISCLKYYRRNAFVA